MENGNSGMHNQARRLSRLAAQMRAKLDRLTDKLDDWLTRKFGQAQEAAGPQRDSPPPSMELSEYLERFQHAPLGHWRTFAAAAQGSPVQEWEFRTDHTGELRNYAPHGRLQTRTRFAWREQAPYRIGYHEVAVQTFSEDATKPTQEQSLVGSGEPRWIILEYHFRALPQPGGEQVVLSEINQVDGPVSVPLTLAPLAFVGEVTAEALDA